MSKSRALTIQFLLMAHSITAVAEPQLATGPGSLKPNGIIVKVLAKNGIRTSGDFQLALRDALIKYEEAREEGTTASMPLKPLGILTKVAAAHGVKLPLEALQELTTELNAHEALMRAREVDRMVKMASGFLTPIDQMLGSKLSAMKGITTEELFSFVKRRADEEKLVDVAHAIKIIQQRIADEAGRCGPAQPHGATPNHAGQGR